MDKILELVGKLDAPISVGICLVFARIVVRYLQAEIDRLRGDNVVLVKKLEASVVARIEDKDLAADRFHTTVVRVEQSMQRANDSQAAEMAILNRISDKLGAV